MDFNIAGLDRVNKAGYIVIGTVFAMMIVAPVIAFRHVEPMPVKLLMFAPIVLLALILAGTYGFAPAGYNLSETQLVVKRRWFGTKTFPLTAFTSIEGNVAETFRKSWKRGAAAGFMGYFGSFSNKTWGRFEAQATNVKKAVILHGPRPLVISPEETELFIEIVEGYLGKRA